MPLIVALMPKTPAIATDLVPSALCGTDCVIVASNVVAPPPLSIAGEVNVLFVPLIVQLLYDVDRVPMFRDHDAACTRYNFAVIVDVFALTFCVAVHEMRNV